MIRQTNDRGKTGINRDGIHTLRLIWGHSGGRAIGHTDLGCARSGEGPTWTRRASGSQTLEAEYRHRSAGAQAVQCMPDQIRAGEATRAASATADLLESSLAHLAARDTIEHDLHDHPVPLVAAFGVLA